ncbi:hypothetical protein Pelo_4583 [Pelomyxa schiedti]|nr:hypothetical protein Pelo_4583 [Pelomyxa schiedti]
MLAFEARANGRSHYYTRSPVVGYRFGNLLTAQSRLNLCAFYSWLPRNEYTSIKNLDSHDPFSMEKITLNFCRESTLHTWSTASHNTLGPRDHQNTRLPNAVVEKPALPWHQGTVNSAKIPRFLLGDCCSAGLQWLLPRHILSLTVIQERLCNPEATPSGNFEFRFFTMHILYYRPGNN